jgi:hypothetical protein
MEMGKQAKRYQAYLENYKAEHGEAIQPEIFHAFTVEGDKLEYQAIYNAKQLNQSGKFYRDAKVYILNSGECVEISKDSRGNSVIAKFPSYEIQQAYHRPMTSQEYNEHW